MHIEYYVLWLFLFVTNPSVIAKTDSTGGENPHSIYTSYDHVFSCFVSFRMSSESNQDVESLILETIKSAVRFQRHVGDALIKVLKNCLIMGHGTVL